LGEEAAEHARQLDSSGAVDWLSFGLFLFLSLFFLNPYSIKPKAAKKRLLVGYPLY